MLDMVGPLLNRLDRGTEPQAQWPQDVLRVNQLSRALYRDVAPFARVKDSPVFRISAGLVADLFPLVSEEPGVRADPNNIPKQIVDQVRKDLTALREEITGGTLPCPPGGESPRSP